MKHLDYNRWYVLDKNKILKMKRVSKQAEEQFPKESRKHVKDFGLISFANFVQDKYKLTLAEAWIKIKRMFNG